MRQGLERGLPRDALPLLSLDDERLAGSGPAPLDQRLEGWLAMAPHWRAPSGGKRADRQRIGAATPEQSAQGLSD